MAKMNCFFCAASNNIFYASVSFVILVFYILNSGYSLAAIDGDMQTHTRDTSDFNFVAAGDYGCGDETNKTVKGMIKKDPELVIALGDLSYDKTVTCWLNSIIPLDTPGRIKITFGDHDLTSKMFKYKEYIRHFNMTKPFYSFNYGNVHFLAMATGKNSIIPYLNGSEQYNFVEQDLRNANDNKSIDWIIVYSFRPFYSSDTEHSGQDVLPITYHPLFDAYDVDLVLQAHNHNYQRTFPLMYNGDSFRPMDNPTIVDKDSTDYTDPKGTVFLTVGTAGAELHNFTGKRPYIVEQFSTNGFVNIEIKKSDNGLKMLGTFYENEDMRKKDHFSITKKGLDD